MNSLKIYLNDEPSGKITVLIINSDTNSSKIPNLYCKWNASALEVRPLFINIITQTLY